MGEQESENQEQGKKEIIIAYGIIAIMGILIVAYFGNMAMNSPKEDSYHLLGQDDFMNLTGSDCNDFELYVRFNDTGKCFKGINQDLSKMEAIWNTCDEDVLVHCKR